MLILHPRIDAVPHARNPLLRELVLVLGAAVEEELGSFTPDAER